LGFLKGLEREDVEFWWDDRIAAGGEWDEEIKARLRDSQIALVLVSQAFLDSDYCRNVEIHELLRLSKKEGLIIFPIILSACEWNKTDWLQSLQFIPGGDETIEEQYTDSGRRKRLFFEIRQKLRERVEDIRSARALLEREAPVMTGDGTPQKAPDVPRAAIGRRTVNAVHVKFSVNTPDGLRRVIFELERNTLDDGSIGWKIGFLLFERAQRSGQFGDPIADLLVEVDSGLNSRAQAMADNGMTLSQSAFAVGPAADTVKDSTATNKRKQGQVEATLRQ
jgi:hypothetical protein